MKIKLKKGLKLNIAGGLATPAPKPVDIPAAICAVVPDDFEGFVPKLSVKEGDDVAIGSPLLFDKNHNQVKLVSPIQGRVKAIVRGERRKIMRIEVEAAQNSASQPQFTKPVDEASARLFLAESGLLALMRRRPYAIVPDPDDNVRDIFVTAIDSAPLAPSFSAFNGIFNKEDLESGVAVLRKITKGNVYISYGAAYNPGQIKGAEMVEIEGQYPSGNPGIQAANIKPVNKGEAIWTLDIATLARIGRLAATGKLVSATVVAIVGPEVKDPALVTTPIGAAVAPLLAKHLDKTDHHRRVISGNVLTGVVVNPDEGFLRFPYRQITVIAEGDDTDEFMGWASLAPSKMSESRSFPGHFISRLFRPDSRLNGGRRAMIMSGQYDQVIPMDILPEYLIKAIIANDIESMEKLGIYEVAPEDFAAAEYVDTSKLPLQQIVRQGLDYLRKELE